MSQGAARSIVMSWPHVPIELVYAAGLRPVIIRSASTPTPVADAHLEPGVLPNRIRQLVDLALGGRLSEAAAIVLPRTSEADYKGFLYLREFVRRGVLQAPEPILLMDLLQSEGRHVAAHNAGAARALFEAFTAFGMGPPVPRWEEALHDAIVRVNAARAALRRLLSLRSGRPRITGTEVLPLIAAFWNLPPEAYVPMATAAAERLGARSALDRPRVLLLGAPVDGPALHEAIEARGAVVVAETGPWGSGAAGADVDQEGEPFAAIATKYQRDSWGARTPLRDVRTWITHAIQTVDAVVVSLPPDDGVFGWDYPWLRDQLRQQGIPHVRVTGGVDSAMSDADQDTLAALIRDTALRPEVHRG